MFKGNLSVKNIFSIFFLFFSIFWWANYTSDLPMVFRAIILKRGYAWSALMICFDSELFPQNFVWQLNNDQKSLEPHRNCQIKSSKWLYFSFHMSQRIDNIQFYSYESIFLTNFKCSKHFALKKSSELWQSSSSRKGRPRIAAFQHYSSEDHVDASGTYSILRWMTALYFLGSYRSKYWTGSKLLNFSDWKETVSYVS